MFRPHSMLTIQGASFPLPPIFLLPLFTFSLDLPKQGELRTERKRRLPICNLRFRNFNVTDKTQML